MECCCCFVLTPQQFTSPPDRENERKGGQLLQLGVFLSNLFATHIQGAKQQKETARLLIFFKFTPLIFSPRGV